MLYGRSVSTIWIARLIVSSATATKLSGRHGLSADEVRDALTCVPGLQFVWDDDPVRGRRAMVGVVIRQQAVIVVLYPVDDPYGGVWRLGSAYPPGGRARKLGA